MTTPDLRRVLANVCTAADCEAHPDGHTVTSDEHRILKLLLDEINDLLVGGKW